MKINEGFEMRQVCGEHVVVAHGERNIDFSKVINMNESAAQMWEAVVGKDFTATDLKQVLLDNYEVSEETAMKDAERIVGEWLEIGLIS